MHTLRNVAAATGVLTAHASWILVAAKKLKTCLLRACEEEKTAKHIETKKC
jgi:hypothetical protein